jgi:hypothetical protein
MTLPFSLVVWRSQLLHTCAGGKKGTNGVGTTNDANVLILQSARGARPATCEEKDQAVTACRDRRRAAATPSLLDDFIGPGVFTP